MDKIVIEGGTPLSGQISISGAKNSALKLMVACLLTDEVLTLTNMPDLRDTRFLGHLLENFGVEVKSGAKKNAQKNKGHLSLHAKTLSSTTAPYDLVRKMRASFNVLGPILARPKCLCPAVVPSVRGP